MLSLDEPIINPNLVEKLHLKREEQGDWRGKWDDKVKREKK